MAVSAVLLLAAPTVACDGEPDQVPHAAPDTLVLRVQEQRSGPAPWELGRLPAFSLYGEGRVVVPVESTSALQQAREFRLPAQEFEWLVANAGWAGLDQARTYEDPNSTDGSLLMVSLRTADGVRTTRVTDPEAGSQVAAYVEGLPGAPRGASEFQPTALAVLATAGVSDGPAAAVPWPLHLLAEGTRTTQGRCTVVTGDALIEAARLAASAEQETRWSSGGSLYAVSFRPLLPDEHSCGDIDIR